MVLSRKFINKIFFYENIIKLFYNNLNTLESFDSNWVSLYYKIKEKNIFKIYKTYNNEGLFGNCLQTKHLKPIYNYNQFFTCKEKNSFYLPDSNIEHMYERLWLNICENYNFNYIIINNFKDYTNEMIKFDINIYRLLNKKESFESNITNIYNLQSNIIITNNKEEYVFSLEQILQKLPIDFDIQKYALNNSLIKSNKYEIIKHAVTNDISKTKETYFDVIDTSNDNINNDIISFMIVFPQFYETDINNEVWGNGFTEWDNLRKTFLINNFHNNLHPHPDIGYYNLLDNKHLKRINSYCNDYNINGMIFYHYWFQNIPIMDSVIKKIIKNKLLKNKNWFFSWVNEHWIKKWDTNKKSKFKDNDIFCKQYYNMQDVILHYNYLHSFFKLSSYYKPDNKPWLSIYRSDNIPSDYLKQLNNLSIVNGFNGITFIKTLNDNNNKNIVNFINKKIDNILYDYEFEFTPNCYTDYFSKQHINYNLSNNELNLTNFKTYINQMQDTFCLKYNTQNVYKCIIKENQ